MSHYLDRAKRQREFKLPTTTEHKSIVVQVYYTKGGPNYAAGGHTPEGFYLSMCPKLFIPSNVPGLVTEEWGFGDGAKAFLETGKRFNAKRLDVLFETIKDTDVYKQLLLHVLIKHGLELKTTTMTYDPSTGNVAVV